MKLKCPECGETNGFRVLIQVETGVDSNRVLGDLFTEDGYNMTEGILPAPGTCSVNIECPKCFTCQEKGYDSFIDQTDEQGE